MPTIEEHEIDVQLATIKAIRKNGGRKEPQRLILTLIDRMTPGQALRRRRAIEQIAHLFNDQPCRQIRKALASKSDLPVMLHEPDSSATKTDEITETFGSTFQSDFQDELSLLRKYHIFSWDVHYYPCFEKYFVRFLSETARLSSSDSGRVLSEPLTKHARDIFSAGYQYKPEESPANRLDASLNGLRRFLDGCGSSS